MDACMTAKGFTKPIGKRGRGGPGQARGEATQANAAGEGQYVDKAALETALTECRSTVSNDENGQPNRQEVDTCMEVKGFKKPEKEKRNPRRERSDSSGTNASGSSRAKFKSAK